MDLERNHTKNILLQQTRGISFEDIREAIDSGYLLGAVNHKNQVKYPGQLLLHVLIDNYVYQVPCVIKEDGKTFFLKTIYPNSQVNKIYFPKN